MSPEEQDRMKQFEALILGTISLLMSPEVQGRMRLWESFDIGHERSVFMSPEEQD